MGHQRPQVMVTIPTIRDIDRSTHRLDHVLHSTIVLQIRRLRIGVGGFTPEGISWRYKLSQHLVGSLTINLLELMAVTITIKVSLRTLASSPSNSGIRILSLTDSSSALGWFHHSFFYLIDFLLHDVVVRELADTPLTHNSALYSQHIPGECNNVADCLFRDFDIPDKELTIMLHLVFPHQMPPNFYTYKLEGDIISWIESMR